MHTSAALSTKSVHAAYVPQNPAQRFVKECVAGPLDRSTPKANRPNLAYTAVIALTSSAMIAVQQERRPPHFTLSRLSISWLMRTISALRAARTCF